MALGTAPVKSPRILVKIPTILRKLGTGGTATQVPIVVKMKASHAELLGLIKIPRTDPMFYGTFPTSAGSTNGGAKYVKNVGGFREKSYTFIANSAYTLNQITVNPDGTELKTPTQRKSIDIGFPKGVTLNELVLWFDTLPAGFRTATNAVRTPQGRRFPL